MAEFGFFGVVVKTRVQTPRFCGQLSRAGDLLFSFFVTRPFRTNWLTVGNKISPQTNFRVFKKPLRSANKSGGTNEWSLAKPISYVKELKEVR
jgi:hypothetical protein